MNMPRRGRAYIEIDSNLIRADTPAEFRELLDCIRRRAGLTPSQIAVKTGIPRSQAYNMVAASRTSLPSKSHQVRKFAEACGLAPLQVGLIMDLWSALDEQAREQAASRAVSLARELPTSAAKISLSGDFITSPMLAGPVPEHHRKRNASGRRRPEAASDLLFLILDDPGRTRRALQLLIPLTLAFTVIVGAFVAWAILQPERASMIGAILGGGFVLPIVTRVRSLVRR